LEGRVQGSGFRIQGSEGEFLVILLKLRIVNRMLFLIFLIFFIFFKKLDQKSIRISQYSQEGESRTKKGLYRQGEKL